MKLLCWLIGHQGRTESIQPVSSQYDHVYFRIHQQCTRCGAENAVYRTVVIDSKNIEIFLKAARWLETKAKVAR